MGALERTWVAPRTQKERPIAGLYQAIWRHTVVLPRFRHAGQARQATMRTRTVSTARGRAWWRVSGQWSVVSGQWSVVSGQWSVVKGRAGVGVG
eukprot:scaffold125070_cov42-Phaeocystis_antarctica.AAC.1